jgi:hypothetical protein
LATIHPEAGDRFVEFALGYAGLPTDAVEEKRGCHENRRHEAGSPGSIAR